jgi:hypothetical protein
LQDVSLKDARIKRDAARQEVRAGVDIVQAKRSAATAPGNAATAAGALGARLRALPKIPAAATMRK